MSSQLRIPSMASFFRTLVHSILFSNLFIAACAFGLVCQTYLLLRVPIRIGLAALAFFATLLVYNLDGLLPYKYHQDVHFSEQKNWVMRHRSFLLTLIAISGLAAGYLFFRFVPIHQSWFIAHLVVISLLYSLRIIPQKNGGFMPLRNVPLVKAFLIAYVWSWVTVLLPLLSLGMPVFSAAGILFLRRFCFLLALALLFDIRDYRKDKLTGTLTLPGLVGIRPTKFLSLTLLGIFAGLTGQTESGPALPGLAVSALAAVLVVVFTHEKRSDYYFLILADGMMLLQFLLVYFFMQG